MIQFIPQSNREVVAPSNRIPGPALPLAVLVRIFGNRLRCRLVLARWIEETVAVHRTAQLMHRYALAIGLAAIACIAGCNPRSGDRTAGNEAAGSNEAVASVDVTNGVDAEVERSPYQISAFTILPRVIPAGMRSPVRVQATIVLHEDLIKPTVTLEQLSPDGVRLSDLGNLVVVEWPGHDVGTARDFRLTPNVFPETKGTTSFRLRLESDGNVEYSDVVNVRTGTPSWEDHSDFVVAFQEQLGESYRKQLESSDHASAAEAVLAEARADKRVRRATLGPGGMDLSIDYAFGVGGTVMLVHPPPY